MDKLKSFWFNSSKIKKTFLVAVPVLLVLLAFFLIFQKKVVDIPFNDGNWEKLQVDSELQPAFVLAPKEERKFLYNLR